MAEQMLLWVSLAALVILAWTRRDRAGLVWVGMCLAIVGLMALVACSIRTRVRLAEGVVASVPQDGSALWWMLELGGLALVGAGVIVMSLVADNERSTRKLSAEVFRVAPHLHGSGQVLLSVLTSATDAGLVLQRPEAADGEFRVLLADERARTLLRAPEDGGDALSAHTPAALAGRIAQAARHAIARGGLSRSECWTGERSFAVAAGLHGDAVIVLLNDVTEQKRAEQSLHRAAFTDPVTGLANRAFLEQEIEEGVARSQIDPDASFAVVCLDFDDFKGVNDRHGHQVGDQLLISIGQRITRVLGAACGEEAFVACRWGGDEFVLILRRVTRAQVNELSERLRAELARPHTLAGVEVTNTASIGVVMCDGGHACAEDLMHEADEAMYAAKNAGKNRVHLRWAHGPIPFPGAAEGGDGRSAAA